MFSLLGERDEDRHYSKTYKWDLTQKNYPVSLKEINEIQKEDEIELLIGMAMDCIKNNLGGRIVYERRYPKTYKWDLEQKNFPVSLKEITGIQEGDEIQLLIIEETRQLFVRSLYFENGKNPTLPCTLKYDGDSELSIQFQNEFVVHVLHKLPLPDDLPELNDEASVMEEVD